MKEVLIFFAGMFVIGMGWFLYALVTSVRKLDTTFTQVISVINLFRPAAKSFMDIAEVLSAARKSLPEFTADVRKQFIDMVDSNARIGVAIAQSNSNVGACYQDLAEHMKALKSRIELFNTLVMDVNQKGQTRTPVATVAAAVAPDEGTFVPALSEDRLAHEETLQQSRERGVELDETRLYVPEAEKYGGGKQPGQ